jgi:hypothetical protein
MSDTIAPALLDTSGLPVSMRAHVALALVWAEDGAQAEVAEEVLAHGLWPYYFLFRIVEVRRVAIGVSCPLPDGGSQVLASIRRERWAWVLVSPSAELEAAVPCT